MTQLQDREAQDGRKPRKPDEARRDASQSLRGSAVRAPRLRRLPRTAQNEFCRLEPPAVGLFMQP